MCADLTLHALSSRLIFPLVFQGDQGGPIYCTADTGELVLVGVAGGYNCETGALFVAIDSTGGVYANA